MARLGRGLEGGEAAPLPILSAFLEEPGAGYLEAAAAAAGSVSFAGRVEHDEVAELIPLAEALVMPSTFPEAFGMVAVEAAACGVLPVSAAHSGMAEVSRQLAPALPAEVAPLVSFPVAEGAVEGIAGRLNAWLGLDEPTRAAGPRGAGADDPRAVELGGGRTGGDRGVRRPPRRASRAVRIACAISHARRVASRRRINRITLARWAACR